MLRRCCCTLVSRCFLLRCGCSLTPFCFTLRRCCCTPVSSCLLLLCGCSPLRCSFTLLRCHLRNSPIIALRCSWVNSLSVGLELKKDPTSATVGSFRCIRLRISSATLHRVQPGTVAVRLTSRHFGWR